MNKRLIVLAATLLFTFIVATAAMAADDPFTGTWKLNAAKSKAPGGSLPHPRSTNVIEVKGQTVHLVADETDGTGKALHVEYTAVYDGKEYPVKQTPSSNESYTISIKRINLRTVEWVESIGKLTIKGQDVLSEDGKSFSRVVNVKGADGHDNSVIQFFEKQ
jgi:hypothetical protein